MADAKITELTELTSVESTDLIAVVDDPSGSPITKKATVSNLTAAKAPIASPTFTGTVTLPAVEIQDTSADHQYVLAVSELTADRTVILPLLTGNDEFVFKDFNQTLTNKTLTSPKIGTAIADTSGNEIIKTPATASAVNEITVTNSATGNAVEISTTGDDTNIDLKLTAKGTGGIQDKNGDYIGPNSSLSRQAIINGNFDVWQRGTSLVITPSTAQFLADRYVNVFSPDSGTLPTITLSRQTITSGDVPNSFYNYRVAWNGAGTSLGNSSYAQTVQKIENGVRYLCGNGKKVTVSFYARSDIANKKLGISLQTVYGTGGSPSSTENIITQSPITLTSSWTKYTVTFTTNTLSGKTFGTANDDYLALQFFYQWGTTVGNGNVYPSVAAETYVGSGYVDIAQVQLCAGDVALPFMPKSFEEELRDCMRYYEFLDGAIIQATSSTGIVGFYSYKVQKRNYDITLTLVSGTSAIVIPGVAGYNLTSVTKQDRSVNFISFTGSGSSGLTSGINYVVIGIKISADAEL